MNRPTEESQIREMLQQLKSADEPTEPSFDDVLNRSSPTTRTKLAYMRWAVAGCAAAALIGAFLVMRSRPHEPTLVTEPDPHSPSEIDFDHLRQVVHDHYHTTESTDLAQLPLWTSRTESLLALSGDMPLIQE